MHSFPHGSNTSPGVIDMKEKESHVGQELRDMPLPPVKGAVTDPEDVLLYPSRPLGKSRPVSLEDTIVFDGWL